MTSSIGGVSKAAASARSRLSRSMGLSKTALVGSPLRKRSRVSQAPDDEAGAAGQNYAKKMVPHGVGTMQRPDGTEYSGDWLLGAMHGKGRLRVKEDGSEWEVDMNDKGTHVWAPVVAARR